MKKELRKLIVVGACIRFEYPAHNFRNVTSKLEPRRLRITSIRDTAAEPVEEQWVALNPTLLRGRYLVTGEDLDKGEERSFYVERMEKVEAFEEKEPLETAEYCVVEQHRVSFATSRIGEAVSFMMGRKRGVLCAVMRNRVG
ncbi:hypothetical protein [Schlesneria sp. T3-172]|uniref:hypothetical protein n=1 Tax=Schlesneria sphaerica TaxID=3373610 RepID=UPI0037CAE7A2